MLESSSDNVVNRDVGLCVQKSFDSGTLEDVSGDGEEDGMYDSGEALLVSPQPMLKLNAIIADANPYNKGHFKGAIPSADEKRLIISFWVLPASGPFPPRSRHRCPLFDQFL